MGIKDGPARVGTVVQVHRRSGPHLAQGRPDPVARYESAYWGTPAAHARAREAVGVAEFDPIRTKLDASTGCGLLCPAPHA
jgi:hypothetical protein